MKIAGVNLDADVTFKLWQLVPEFYIDPNGLGRAGIYYTDFSEPGYAPDYDESLSIARYTAPGDFIHNDVGFIASGSMKYGGPFASGRWEPVQVVKDYFHKIDANGAPYSAITGRGLDNTLPYAGPFSPFTIGDSFNDTPATRLDTMAIMESRTFTAEDYDMFLPPGDNSRWVAVAQLGWQWNAEAKRANIHSSWALTASGQSPDNNLAGKIPDEPSWTRLVATSSIPWQPGYYPKE